MFKHIITAAFISPFLSLSNTTFATNNHDHTHHHEQSETVLKAAQGIFADSDIKDRTLADWQGTWQSIYSYLLDGSLDPVLHHKADVNNTKTFDEYKDYYKKGYATEIEMIGIKDNTIDFHTKEATYTCEYHYSGFKILTYASGNKGVRYLFECSDKQSTAPKYIQFSDHIIEPTQSHHYHLYMGNESHEALLQEMDNWPTFYPLSWSKNKIVHEMLNH